MFFIRERLLISKQIFLTCHLKGRQEFCFLNWILLLFVYLRFLCFNLKVQLRGSELIEDTNHPLIAPCIFFLIYIHIYQITFSIMVPIFSTFRLATSVSFWHDGQLSIIQSPLFIIRKRQTLLCGEMNLPVYLLSCRLKKLPVWKCIFNRMKKIWRIIYSSKFHSSHSLYTNKCKIFLRMTWECRELHVQPSCENKKL